MRTEKEIQEKIDALMEVKRNMLSTYVERREEILCQIDALLWVLGDESGLPLLDERN